MHYRQSPSITVYYHLGSRPALWPCPRPWAWEVGLVGLGCATLASLFFFEKHKLFLYKEDFDKFEEGFREALEAISKLKESGEYPDLKGDNFNEKNEEEKSEKGGEGYTDVNFDDL